MTGPPLALLARPLRGPERAGIARRWATAFRNERACELPATAFVSIYERGRVIGCVGHADVLSALRAARADPRFGGARLEPRESVVQLSLLVRGPTLAPSEVERTMVVGREGLVAFDAAGIVRAVLLPEVAADGQRDAASMLRALAGKAGLTSLDEIPRVMRVRAERFVVRGARSRRSRSPIEAAAAWLAARIGLDGEIAHGIDARSGRVHRTGPLHLGRCALVVQALEAHGGHRAAVRRARRWLALAIEEALRDAGEGLPKSAPERAGSLALAMRAGIHCDDALIALSMQSSIEIAGHAWHAAQVTVALANRTPQAIRDAALAPIDRGAWAPWSVLAADALGDCRRARKARSVLARSVAARAPHAGGVGARSVPEVALTALVIEILATTHPAAARRALGFLASQSFTTERDVPAALDLSLCIGAYPLAPHADFLRCDVTAHALLAQLAVKLSTGVVRKADPT